MISPKVGIRLQIFRYLGLDFDFSQDTDIFVKGNLSYPTSSDIVISKATVLDISNAYVVFQDIVIVKLWLFVCANANLYFIEICYRNHRRPLRSEISLERGSEIN